MNSCLSRVKVGDILHIHRLQYSEHLAFVDEIAAGKPTDIIQYKVCLKVGENVWVESKGRAPCLLISDNVIVKIEKR